MAMRWCLTVLLPLVVGALTHHEIEGVYSAIRPEDVRHTLTNRIGFLSAENRIRSRFDSLSSHFVADFFVDFFEIHGDEHDRSTVIFHGFLSTDLKREEIEKLVDSTDDLHIFILVEKESIPSAPSLLSQKVAAAVSSCSNGGILLPNATCACKPFYSGELCEIVQCLHEGIQNGARCACPPGVQTVNCEPRSCIPSVSDDFQRTQSSFILVINQDTSAARFLNYFFGELQNLDFSSYNTFIVVNYLDSDKGFYMQQKQFVYWTDMVDYLNGIVSVSSGKDKQPTNKAILAAQSTFPNMLPFSRIIVITAKPDSDDSLPSTVLSSSNTATRLILKTIAWRNRVLYLIPLTLKMNIGNHFDVFLAVSSATLGDTVFLETDEGDAENLVPVILNELYPFEPIDYVEGENVADLGETLFSNSTVVVTVKDHGILPNISTDVGDVTVLATGAFIQIVSIPQEAQTITVLGTNKWTLKVLSDSISTALISYSTDDNVDVGTAYTISGIKNVDQYTSAQLIGASGSALLEWVDPTTSKVIKKASHGEIRTNDCSFTLNFNRTDVVSFTGPFLQRIIFDDENEQRVIPGFAVELDAQFPVPYLTCLNGGSLSRDGMSCNCTQLFLTKDCSVPLCYNGGSPNPFPGNGQDLCSCPQGYHGDHCEKLVCTSNSVQFSGNKSIAIVLQNTMSQGFIRDDIVSGLGELFATDGVSYQEFVLTTFATVASGGQNIPRMHTTTVGSPVELLGAITKVSYLASYTQTQDSLTALQQTIDAISNENSVIFLFVDSPPSSFSSEDSLVMSALSKRSQLNVVVAAPFGESACIDAATRQQYQNLAINTGGLFLNLCFIQGATIEKFFDGYTSAIYGTQLVSEYPATPCNQTIARFPMTADRDADAYFVLNGDVSIFMKVALVQDVDTTDTIALQQVPGLTSGGIYKIPTDRLQPNKEYHITAVPAPSYDNDLCSAKLVTKSSFSAVFSYISMSSGKLSNSLNYGHQSQVTVFFKGNSSIDGNLRITTNDYIEEISEATTPDECLTQIPFPDPVTCDSPNNQYIITVVGTYSDGNSFTRSQRAICYMSEKSCLNGGSWNNNKCDCPPGYNGTLCEVSSCENGFVLQEDGTCQCGGSFTGDRCQYEMCNPFNFMEATDVREFDFKQIIFVLNTNMDMLLVNVYLKNMIKQFMVDTQDFTDPRQFTLVTFDENDVKAIVSTWSIDEFANAFNNALSGFSSSKPTQTRSLDALHQALRLVVQPTAAIFLVTGSDSTNFTMDSTILPRQKLGTQINVVYIPQGLQLVSPPRDERLVNAAKLSGGRVLPINQNDMAAFNQIASDSLTENALILDTGVADCSETRQSFAFYVEYSATRLVFDLVGDGIAKYIIVDDQRGQPVNVTWKYKDAGSAIAEITGVNGSLGGQWSFGIFADSGSCYVQVRVESSLRVIPGFIVNAHDDFPSPQPFTKRNSPRTRMAFRVSGDPSASIVKLEVNEANPAKPWNSNQTSFSNVHPRDGASCAFQYISDFFDMNNTITYQKIFVRGRNRDGDYFQRIFWYEVPDPDYHCANGQIDFNEICTCDNSHYGDDCSERRCQNGGTSTFGVCACANGYFGPSCEDYILFNGTTAAPPKTTPTTPATTAEISTSTENVTTNGGITSETTVFTEGTTTVAMKTTQSATSIESSSPSPSEGLFETTAQPSGSTSTEQNSSVSPTGSPSVTTVQVTTDQETSGTDGPIAPNTSGSPVTELPPVTVEPMTTRTSGGGESQGTTQASEEVSTVTGGSDGTPGASETTRGATPGPTQENTETTLKTTAEPATGITQVETTNENQTPPSVAPSDSSTMDGGTQTEASDTTTVGSTKAPVPETETTEKTGTTEEIATTSSEIETTTNYRSTQTTTMGPCDPTSTTYFYSFFIDSDDLFMPPGQTYQAEQDTVAKVATSTELGSGRSNTRFALSGFASVFYSGGIATNLDEVNGMFNDGELYGEDGDSVTDLNAAINGYLSSNYSTVLAGEQPAIAVLFAKQQPSGSQADFVGSVNKLKAASYSLIGIDMSAGWDAGVTTYFNAALGKDSVHVFQNSNDAATFITTKGCQIKPL